MIVLFLPDLLENDSFVAGLRVKGSGIRADLNLHNRRVTTIG